MRVVVLDNRTCVVSRTNILKGHTKVKLKKLVNGRFGKKRWKTVASTYYGLHSSELGMLTFLENLAEERRKSRRNKIRYNKLRKGL